MFNLAILIGIYSYIIFFLGINNLLYRDYVNSVSVGFILFLLWFFRKSLIYFFRNFRTAFSRIIKDKISLTTIILLLLLSFTNLIGALGPELAFDALWYHLTLPKIFIDNHSIFHIPGGLLYYSDMPKLGEMLYIGALSFGNEIYAKVIHWFFGLLILSGIYKLSRKFFNQQISLLAALIFYSSLVVAWESTTAYIDLIRTFFELLAFAAFINWWQSLRKKWFIVSAIMIGLATATKLLAIGSIFMFIILIFYKKALLESKYKAAFLYSLIFAIIVLLTASPWFLFAYLNTGNPIYPIFSEIFSTLNTKIFDISLLNPLMFLETIWKLFTYASDPLNPIYIIFFPLLVFYFFKSDKAIKVFFLYFILALGCWYLTSQVEGSRLILPYLPVVSILCAGLVDYIKQGSTRFPRKSYIALVLLIFLIAIITIVYRGVANKKYIPVIVGNESKEEFLTKNLNFSFGDFYDIDDYFAKTITEADTVLLYGFHNLYYVNFPYTHDSWIKPGESFNYIAVQGGELPERFSSWKLIYENKTTNVKLYSDGGKRWKY